MNQIVNLEMSVRKEIDLESQGFRRTRRWIGDAKEVRDPKWYQSKVSQISEDRLSSNESNWTSQTKPRTEFIHSTLTRYINLPYTLRESVRIKA